MIRRWRTKLSLFLVALALSTTAYAAPQTFGSPEAAVKALQAALRAKDQTALVAIFGPDFKRLQDGDAAQRASTNDRLNRLFKEGWSLTTTQDQHRVIRVGYEGWSFPVPLVKKGSLWSFDVPLGIEEIANRRVGRNELMVIDTFRQFSQAQELFHQASGKYATKLLSSAGQKDGLYWPSTSSADASPLQKVIGDVAALTANHAKGTPWYGYYFTMTPTDKGYVFVAWPVTYKTSGVMSFWMDQAGRLYEKDLGSRGGSFLRSVDASFDLQGWTLVSQSS
jgi:hypothetical protein